MTRAPLLLWGSALLVVSIDVLTKYSVRKFFPDAGYEIFSGLSLRLFENIRGPFGIASVGIAAFVGGVVLVLWVWFSLHTAQRQRGWTSTIGVGILLGGGLSNSLERVLAGRTTDILWVGDLTAINVADGAILVGLALLLTTFLRPLVESDRPTGTP